MKVITAAKMREIDSAAMEQYGIPAVALMENAGTEAAKLVEKLVGNLKNKKICIFSGSGNNGGDGFVAARHLSNRGARVKIFLLGNIDHITDEAKINLEIVENMNIDILQLVTERDWDKVQVALAFSDCLVDALLGTGFKGNLTEPLAKIIQMINNSGKKVLSIDLPSGVEADTGNVVSVAVKASMTLSLGLAKVGLLFYPGAQMTGELFVDDIGIPSVLLEDSKINQTLIDLEMVRRLLVKRSPDVHKGICGRVLVIAGSPGLTGAAALVTKAALRSGAGVVTLAVAKSLHDIFEVKLTEVMTVSLPEIDTGILGLSALPKLLELAQQYDVVEIGSGLGRNPATVELIQEFVRQTDRQLILDADAINAYHGKALSLKEAQIMPILTPHLGELATLLNLSIEEIKEDLLEISRRAAAEYNAIFVVKSAKTIVVYPDGNLYITTTGNAGMATAGSGDVLAGTISALSAQGLLSYTAAIAGVYLHGFAGDLAARAGMSGIIASDIVNAIPSARFGIEAE
ncbi:bifunctional ADP-dependent NAD(P)H-hydrate dehydratase/NAD(P)H-hydrate epimerase [Propionispira raffinosivorans]|uniref:bifunctional ADP-dependent NAD(P)H-hydrate dehydratase/NAD(P)H-hydrate epimerase n=1 Tax=Propionispira raffinosivorans TaxID=86959 RepID=UPI0003813F0C|nr:bifunctional ADP-dependent NAD(P)H-hydrate dehydratase/NAD(P)H-hydrate epimerase [Propionispira raffinosivorans]